MITIAKGKFSKPRTPQQEDREIEQAFRQVTEIANGQPFQEPEEPVSQAESAPQKAPAKKAPAQKASAPRDPAHTGTTAARKSASARPASAAIAHNRKIAIAAIASACAVLVLCISLGTWFYFNSTKDDGLIYSNVCAAGINLGGMTPEQAASAIHTATDNTFPVMDMVVNTNKGMLSFAPADTGVHLDVDRLVADAVAHGRGGSRSENAAAREQAALTTFTIELLPYLNLDTQFIRQTVDSFVASQASVLTQASVTETGTMPDLEKIPEEIPESTHSLTVTAGTPGLSIDADAIYDAVLDSYNGNDFSGIKMDFQIADPKAPDADQIYQKYCTAPVDAQLDPKTFEITPETWGYGLPLGELKAILAELDQKDSVEIPLRLLEPRVTADDLKGTLFQDTLGGYVSSYNEYNYPRANNLELAAAAINGTILLPGDTFSFNDVVGERTREKGYQSAGAYVAGETVDQVGGGICQVASTIYYSALLADLEIVDREEHMYAVSYVPMGMDATINWGTIDFKFKNNTAYPIRMETKAEDGEVHVTLLGTDDKDYYVEMEYEIDKTYDWETVEKKFPPDNEKKYEDGEVISDPYTGYDVTTYRCKYSKDTDELISREKEAVSNFEKRDKVICVIEDPNATTEPETTAPETSQPEITEPETTAPETTQPETTEPETTTPETTQPETTEPETTAPETTQPETTEPETTTPETSEPETSQPETSEPETSEPASPESSGTEPETPEIADPETSAPADDTEPQPLG